MNIQPKLLLWLGLVFVLVLASVLAIGRNITQEKVLQDAHQRNGQLLGYGGKIVDIYMLDLTSSVEAVANRQGTADAITSGDPQKINAVMEELTGIKRREGIMLSIELHAANCTGIASDFDAPVSVAGKDFSDRDYCKGILASRAKYVSGSYISLQSKNPVVSVVMPVDGANGSMAGFINVLIDVKQLNSYFIGLAGNESRLFLDDRYGREFTDTGDPQWLEAESDNVISHEVASQVSAGETSGYFDSIDKSGTTYVVDFRKFDYFTIVIAQIKPQVTGVADSLMYSFTVICIGVFLIDIVTAWFLLRFIVTERFGRITSVVSRISKGDMKVAIDDDLKKSPDEIGELARAFDRVLASLKLAVMHTGMNKSEIGLGACLIAKKGAEDKYLKLFNSINEAVMVNRMSPGGPGKFVEVNDYACKLFGYTRDELLGMSPHDLDTSALSVGHFINAVKSQLSGEPVNYGTVLKTKDGRRIRVEVELHSVKLGKENLILHVAHVVGTEDAAPAWAKSAPSAPQTAGGEGAGGKKPKQGAGKKKKGA